MDFDLLAIAGTAGTIDNAAPVGQFLVEAATLVLETATVRSATVSPVEPKEIA
jgi:hypothetical protein